MADLCKVLKQWIYGLNSQVVQLGPLSHRRKLPDQENSADPFFDPLLTPQTPQN